MVPKSEVVWMDGAYVPFDEAHVHLMTHTLHYGLGVFEGVRCYDTADGGLAIFRLDEHLRRLYESAHIVLMDVPYPLETLREACLELVRRNGMQPCYLRPLVFLGAGRMGLGSMDNPVQVAVTTWRWGAYLGQEGLERGIRARISSFTRPHVNTSMVKGKIVGQYVNSILAKREAVLTGFDEAILLDTEGWVSEATGENVFAVRDGRIFTTPETGTILAGITRDAVVTLARDRGYEVREERFTRDFLYGAEEVFLTGTAAEVTPVREIDGRRIGGGAAGPVALGLQRAYFDAVRGADPRHPDWLARVEPASDAATGG